MAARQASLSFTVSWSLVMSIGLVMLINHPILSHPLLLLPSISPASGSLPVSWLFTLGGQRIGASTSASVLPMNTLISFRIDWLDLAVQGTLKNILQHHNSKTSILWCSVFFMVQLSYPYMTIGKTIALTRWSFVSKVISLLFILFYFIFLLVGG